MRERSFFQYVVGSFVKVAQGALVQRVVWRDKQVVANIIGQPHEVPVYHLNDDYWDCYYEHQIHLAQPWDQNTPA